MDLPRPQVDPLALQGALRTIGYTLWQVQQLEETVGMYLVIVHKLQPGVARDEAEAVLERTRKHSLGHLLNDLKTKPTAARDLVDRLDRFVPERNWLVHRSRHDSHLLFYPGRSAQSLNDRLERIADEALSLMKGFISALEAYLISLGRKPEDLESEARRILKEWGAA